MSRQSNYSTYSHSHAGTLYPCGNHYRAGEEPSKVPQHHSAFGGSDTGAKRTVAPPPPDFQEWSPQVAAPPPPPPPPPPPSALPLEAPPSRAPPSRAPPPDLLLKMPRTSEEFFTATLDLYHAFRRHRNPNGPDDIALSMIGGTRATFERISTESHYSSKKPSRTNQSTLPDKCDSDWLSVCPSFATLGINTVNPCGTAASTLV